MNLMKHVKVAVPMLLTVLTILMAASRANAQFVVIDTFEKESLGPINGQNGWTSQAGVADKAHCFEPQNANGKLGCAGNEARVQVVVDPTDPNNHVLQYGAKAETVHTFKAMRIPNANTASTLFFRARRTGEVNMNWGLSDEAAPSNWNDYEVQLNMQTVDTNKIRIRDGNKAVESVLMPANTWYKTWFVINNANDTYEVFMQGGTMDKITQITAGGKTEFGFRNGHADNDLINIFLRTTPPHNADFQFDDIYLDTAGRNLTDPSVAAPTARR